MLDDQAIAKPKLARVVTAFAMAPLAGTLAFVMLMAMSMVSDLLDPSAETAYMLEVNTNILEVASFVILVYAFGSTIVLGLPVYFLLRTRGLISPVTSVLAGGFVALMSALLVLLSGEGAQSNIEGFSGLLAKIFGCGLIAGLVFWLCAFWRDPAFSQAERP